jgi:hypothetical protein
MKTTLFFFFLLLSSAISAQKLLLIDKKLTLPIKSSNTFTTQDNFSGYFPVEKELHTKFVEELEKIVKLLKDKSAKKPETLLVHVGETTFQGIRVPLAEEERMDIVVFTNINDTRTTMHLCDAKLSNTNNAFFINTWLKYIRGK